MDPDYFRVFLKKGGSFVYRYRKVFIVLVVLLMLVNIPVYAEEEEEVYTLKRGKIYVFRFRENNDSVEVVFSDDVLTGVQIINEYNELDTYNRYGKSRSWKIGYLHDYLHVYNVSDSDVTARFSGSGRPIEVVEYEPPFSLLHYDASEEPIEFINRTEETICYNRFEYNEFGGSIAFNNSIKSLDSGKGVLTFGKGAFLFPISAGNVQYYLDIQGVYEVRNYIRKSFFRIPPWILKTDLAGIIRALLGQLSMLLPVGLVILSVFLLISLIRYIVRSFL